MLTCTSCGIDESDLDVDDPTLTFTTVAGGQILCASCAEPVLATVAGGGRGHTSMGRREAGSATLWVVFVSVALLAMAGLVIDGGYTMSAKREASRVAEQAARAGADQLDTDSLRTGGSDLDVSQARAAAERYVAGAGLRGQVSVNGGEVTVTVTKTTKTVILSAFGAPGGYTVHSSATARSIDGINDR